MRRPATQPPRRLQTANANNWHSPWVGVGDGWSRPAVPRAPPTTNAVRSTLRVSGPTPGWKLPSNALPIRVLGSGRDNRACPLGDCYQPTFVDNVNADHGEAAAH